MIDYRVQTFPKTGFVFVSFWTYFIEYVKRIRSKFWQPTRSSPDMLKSVMQVKEKWKKKWASSHTPRCNIARECCTLCIPLLWKVVLVNQVVNHKWILVIKDTHNGLTLGFFFTKIKQEIFTLNIQNQEVYPSSITC